MLLFGEDFKIEIDEESGTPRAIVSLSDPYEMNWLREERAWGEVAGFRLLSTECEEGGVCVRLENAARSLGLTVRRWVEGGAYREEYTFRNLTDGEVLLSEETVSLAFPYSDHFNKALGDMIHRRCNSHIYCAEDVCNIHSVKLDGQPPYLIQEATAGRFVGYGLSMDVAIAEFGSHDRGTVLLYPEAVALAAGESVSFCFRFFFAEERPPISPVTVDRYSAFESEVFTLSVLWEEPITAIAAEAEGEEIPLRVEGCSAVGEVCFSTVGERRIRVEVNGRRTYITLNVLAPLDDILERRARFITEHQQYLGDDPHLFGAYLIYDRKTGELYCNEGFADHNAARERLSMGALVAHALSRRRDAEMERSLRLHRAFIEREILDVPTGFVGNGIGRRNVRLYNFPWVSTYYLEWYRFSGEVDCLLTASRILRKYYELGGAKQESPCLEAFEILGFLAKEGLQEEYDALRRDFVAHGDAIVERRTASHSTEVACANGMMNLMCTFLFQVYLLTRDEKYLASVPELLKISESFYALQPDHRRCGIALRYWDMYWFGKGRAYGDTYPQWLSALTGQMYHYCDLATGSDHAALVRQNLLGNLAVFFADGSAACGYLGARRVIAYSSREGYQNPTRPIGVWEGEHYDEFANDQDWSLYYAARYLLDGGTRKENL